MSETGIPPRRRPRYLKTVVSVVMGFSLGAVVTGLALVPWVAANVADEKGLVLQVTPIVVSAGGAGTNLAVFAPCNDTPQASFTGAFHCTVTVSCADHGPGNSYVEVINSTQAMILKVSPVPPVYISCLSSFNQTFDIAGLLGYSGSVTVDVF